MKRILAFVSISVMAGVLAVNVYHSIIDTRSWGASIPDSIATARSYFSVVNPGTFFRVASPLNQALALITLIAFWKSSRRARLWFGLAFLFAVIAEALTYAYFFPRNDVLFLSAELNVEVMKRTWSEWSRMNWIRNAILALGLLASTKGLDSHYQSTKIA